jgi:hypothetical protein
MSKKSQKMTHLPVSFASLDEIPEEFISLKLGGFRA